MQDRIVVQEEKPTPKPQPWDMCCEAELRQEVIGLSAEKRLQLAEKLGRWSKQLIWSAMDMGDVDLPIGVGNPLN